MISVTFTKVMNDIGIYLVPLVLIVLGCFYYVMHRHYSELYSRGGMKAVKEDLKDVSLSFLAVAVIAFFIVAMAKVGLYFLPYALN